MTSHRAPLPWEDRNSTGPRRLLWARFTSADVRGDKVRPVRLAHDKPLLPQLQVWWARASKRWPGTDVTVDFFFGDGAGKVSTVPCEYGVGGGGFAKDYAPALRTSRDQLLHRQLSAFNNTVASRFGSPPLPAHAFHNILDIMLRISAAWDRLVGAGWYLQGTDDFFHLGALLFKTLQYCSVPVRLHFERICSGLTCPLQQLAFEALWAVVCDEAGLPSEPQAVIVDAPALPSTSQAGGVDAPAAPSTHKRKLALAPGPEVDAPAPARRHHQPLGRDQAQSQAHAQSQAQAQSQAHARQRARAQFRAQSQQAHAQVQALPARPAARPHPYFRRS
jgi:hypothetical protein